MYHLVQCDAMADVSIYAPALCNPYPTTKVVRDTGNTKEISKSGVMQAGRAPVQELETGKAQAQ